MPPLFQWPRLLLWMAIIAEATAAMMARWELLAAGGQPIDFAAARRHLTQGIMRQVLFGPHTRVDTQAGGRPSRRRWSCSTATSGRCCPRLTTASEMRRRGARPSFNGDDVHITFSAVDADANIPGIALNREIY
jgi:hypothetical protein